MGPDGDDAPYPASERVRRIEWGPTTSIERSHGDNWPMTWVEGDLQLLAWGDGTGFDGERPLSMGFAELRGDPPDLRAAEFESDADDLPLGVYERCLGWCTEEGVTTVADLAGRVVSRETVLEAWVRRCRALPEHPGDPADVDDYT